ncbi:MAG: YggT family protein [Candidatus Coatesbacteria bacterium]|nr:YggT family protein [Candidatus Coatesbacteria bacterium]
MAGAFLISLAELVIWVLTALIYVIMARVVLSWIIRPNPYSPPNPVVHFLSAVTDPLLNPLRRILPRLGPLDLSPMVAIAILMFLKIFIQRSVQAAF